ncbi:DUF6795 domain-containing protein [Teredinibacter sp. KSP-S5-2]|uniref:DUF6795 domain-containing protein n=1 Tax=Teredinibacter sp. KSP-S5-2 TaxID=3034506 RepID=UPI002934C6DE|nr:DUF6795 domain-containing protein [Teredinibacter sp. KSP-S5-2]WNO08051.1 hypothetical protein P5V12_13800 [Teredinibacter sp. KSP-S5-2]
MSMLFPKKICLFSGFTGQVTISGSPVGEVLVKRSFEFEGKTTEEEITTNSHGYFTFESVWTKTPVSFLIQFVVQQRIYVYVNEKEYIIWGGAKLIEDEFGEFNGKVPKNLVCKLEEDIRRVDMEIGAIGTNCYWE